LEAKISLKKRGLSSHPNTDAMCSLINSDIFRKKTWNETSISNCKFEMTPSSELLVIHTQWNGNPKLFEFHPKKRKKTQTWHLKVMVPKRNLLNFQPV